MLKIHITNDRTHWLWRVEIVSPDEGIVFSRVAHNLEQLSLILIDASKMVDLEAAKEGKQS